MKIAILTFPITLNYGCVLQSFALQTSLEKMGHKVTILDKRDWRTSTSIGNSLVIIKSLLQCCIGKRDFGSSIHNILSLTSTKKRGKLILDFVDRYLHLSKRIYSFNKRNHNYTSTFDAYIVGSDQVWRYAFLSRFLNNYYLDFASDNSKKLSYAASFGVDSLEYPKNKLPEYTRLINRFTAISVREDSGVELCKHYYNKNAVHVIDPVFLLSPKEYRDIIGFDETNAANLQTYILDNSENKESIIKHIVSSTGYSPNNLMPFSEKENQTLPSVSKWLGSIHSAKYVVTDSFHGTAFAILFNREFVVMGNPNRGNARMMSLLRMFNLENRLISSVEEYDRISNNTIAWNDVNNKIKLYREQAISFLMNALA